MQRARRGRRYGVNSHLNQGAGRFVTWRRYQRRLES